MVLAFLLFARTHLIPDYLIRLAYNSGQWDLIEKPIPLMETASFITHNLLLWVMKQADFKQNTFE